MVTDSTKTPMNVVAYYPNTKVYGAGVCGEAVGDKVYFTRAGTVRQEQGSHSPCGPCLPSTPLSLMAPATPTHPTPLNFPALRLVGELRERIPTTVARLLELRLDV